MRLSVFESLFAETCQPVEIEWPALVSYLAAPPEYPTKAACPLLKLSAFGTALSAKGSVRHDANVLALSGVEGDHDAGTMSPGVAAGLLQAAGISALVCTTASHTPAVPRWRVLAPLSQAYAPAAHRELVGRLNGVLGGTLRSESFALSQAYYFGRVAGVPYEAFQAVGQPLDLVHGLVPVFPAFQGATGGDFTLTDAPVPEWRGPEDDADLLRRALMSRSAAGVFGGRASFADLWECNTEALAVAFPDSTALYNASQADAALAAHLCFWTGRNGERVHRLMLQSGLVRDKWQRDDYLPRTIASILAAPGSVLTDKVPEPPSVPHADASAPTQSEVTGQTFLGPAEQKALFSGCVYVQHSHTVLVPGGALLDPGRFRVAFGGYVFAMDAVNERTTRNAWEAFTESQVLRAPRADTICFRPDRAPGEIISTAGKRRANTWWPADVRRVTGDVTPFLTHLRKVLPNERDQQILLSYMAACVQHKGVKFGWAPVLQGVEGNGKTLFSACVAEAVGQHYTHWPHAADLESPFNGWVANKLLVAVEELYSQEHQAEVIERLKTLVTGGMGIQIQFKGVDQESMQIVANFMATTNYKAAVRKTPDNLRRLALFYTAQQSYADLVREGMTGEYFPKLYGWLKADGFAIVAELLHTYPIDPAFNPAGQMHRAPDTSSTEAAIVESRGNVEQQIAEVIAQETPGFMGGWVSSVMLDRLITDTLKMGSRLSLSKRRELLQGMGYILHPGLADGRTNNAVMPDGKRPQLFVLANHPAAALRGGAEIARAYSAAQTVQPVRA